MKFRTRYLIHPKFQLMFSSSLVLIALIAALIVGILIRKLIYANNLIFVKYNVHLQPEFLSLLAKERHLVLIIWIGSFLVISVFLFFAGIFLSHKMAGPLYALTREMTKLKNGDYTAYLGLRRRDEFKELKIPFNQWVEMLRTMTEDDIEHISQLLQDKEISKMKDVVESLEALLKKKKAALIPFSQNLSHES